MQTQAAATVLASRPQPFRQGWYLGVADAFAVEVKPQRQHMLADECPSRGGARWRHDPHHKPVLTNMVCHVATGGTREVVIIAGTRLTETEVAVLAGKLRDADMSECSDRIVDAFWEGERLFSLSTDERAAIYDALDECPDELRSLRASLQEQLV